MSEVGKGKTIGERTFLSYLFKPLIARLELAFKEYWAHIAGMVLIHRAMPVYTIAGRLAFL